MLGEWQQAWLETLESDIYEQTQNCLCFLSEDGLYSFSALGLVCQVAIENGVNINCKEPETEGVVLFDNQGGILPEKIRCTFKFYNRKAAFSGGGPITVRENLDKYLASELNVWFLNDNELSIIGLNDNFVDFKTISKTIRKYPELIFYEES